MMEMTVMDKDRKTSQGSDYGLVDYNVVPSSIPYTSTY
jgi:hypothetical protein